jgi:hypothetical protein
MSIKSSPNTAPSYALYREGVVAADADVTVFTKKHGCNASMYKYAHIQIIPSDDANPNVAVWWWSDQADRFIQEQTPIAKTGVGANTPYEFSIEPMGRIFFVQVATLAEGSVDILVSGFESIQLS